MLDELDNICFALLNTLLGTDVILVQIGNMAGIGMCLVLLTKVNISILRKLFHRGV